MTDGRVIHVDFGSRRGRMTEYDRESAADFAYRSANKIDEDPDRYEEALRLYQRAVELHPQFALAYTNLGCVFYRMGKTDGAVAAWQKAIELDPRQPEAHFNLGCNLLETGRPRMALRHFEKAIEADPQFACAHYNAGMARHRMCQYDAARTHLEAYLRLEPTGSWADIAKEHLK